MQTANSKQPGAARTVQRVGAGSDPVPGASAGGLVYSTDSGRIQGDHVERLMQAVRDKGFAVKRVGG